MLMPAGIDLPALGLHYRDGHHAHDVVGGASAGQVVHRGGDALEDGAILVRICRGELDNRRVITVEGVEL